MRVVDGVLEVHDEYPRDAFADPNVHGALMSSCVYVVHELIHVAQGFADMESVTEARAIGAEPTILQIDLTADHITTVALSRVRPDWDVMKLKNHTGRDLAAFSVGTFHTEASRQRKASRLVGLRFDLAARRRWKQDSVMGGYFWLDFAPGGDRCLAFFSGPPARLICPALSFAPGERDILVASADGNQPFETVLQDVDRVVERLALLAHETRFHGAR